MPKKSSSVTIRSPFLVVSGFTFIELLVVLVIMTTFFGVGFANYRQFQQRQKIQAVARTALADLRYAQENALASRKPVHPRCNDPQTLSYYSFRRTNVSSYEVRVECSGPGGPIAPIKQVDFGSDFQISPFAPGNEIRFYPRGMGTNIGGLQTQFTLTYTPSGQTMIITVLSSGIAQSQ